MIITKRCLTCCVALVLIAASVTAIAQNHPAGGAKEIELIAVLQSDAAKGDKAITCKQLAIYGTDKSVPALAPLLADQELSSWARIALEAIPGPVADAALRDAIGKVQGRLLVGVINSVAVRRDVKAVNALENKLGDANPDVASAAAVALGHLGGDHAAKTLMQLLNSAPTAVRSAVAQGCILCAEGFLASGRTADAVKLYDSIRQADLPDQRHLEAIRGAILARGSAGVPLLLEQLQSKDEKRLGIGLRTARELGGRDVTESLAAELTKLTPDRRPLLLLAIADRKDSAVLPTVLMAAESDSKDLRITAINILIHLGDVSCVPVLLKAATQDDTQLQQAATETLVRLPGKDVDSAVISNLQTAQGKRRQVLIEVAGQRQIAQALPAVVSSLKDTDAGIRNAAVGTIGIIGQDQQAGDLVGLLLKTKDSSQRGPVRKALTTICGRCGANCIPHLRPLTKSNDNELQIMGLQAMAIVGGSEALEAVNSAIAGAESPVQDEAVRILSTWPNDWPEDSQAGQALLKLASSAQKMSHHVLGVRGYLQYIRGNKKLSNEQKVVEVRKVLIQTKRPEERLQAVAVLGEAPSASALELLTKLAEDSSVTEEAYSAMVLVAARQIAGVSNETRKQVLQTVAEKSRNNGTRQRAQKALSGIR